MARKVSLDMTRNVGIMAHIDAGEICVALTLVREDRVGLTSGLPVVAPAAPPGS